ncbi:patatin-like phospholipase family protein [Alicyclobacillus dauci]|uniref:Patatin-like phospholipase family protein n=1 Tax=Alicyclobacillus dauci TaxID=1475485 RepID=A0ABY6YXZ5_9BACL|nr:patatin-like phospholipase family protein [Alicyclobacillus dauci]WAH35479.1 patatin-like phospholipase family protein [Alicyclobacillus dauci]
MHVRIALALGSGGAKGFAHIGVISALSDHHIPIHAIAGSSMGSLVGACYAMGTSPRMMEGIAVALKRRLWLDFTVPKMGLIQGDRVREVVALLTRNGRIEDANIPLAIVATELLSRQRVVFRSGSIADAVRASISIPGAFVPFIRDGSVYVDGGVLDRVPVRAAWELGADVVIGVDVGMTPTGTVPGSMIDVIMQSLEIMQDQVHATDSQTASITIVPEVSHIGTAQFSRAGEAIDLGYQATVRRIPEITSLLGEKVQHQ